MADLPALEQLIASHPIIDNHAHNILKASSATNYSKYPLESITSEAQGEALIQDSLKSLAHIRSVQQLAQFYGCDENWDAIKAARAECIARDYDGLVRRCLEGSHMLLIDDGLTADDVEGYSWHDRFTPATNKRIVRIEALAVDVIMELLRKHLGMRRSSREFSTKVEDVFIQAFWEEFENDFRVQIERALDDDAVVGFKSVICYRTGLKIDEPSPEQLMTSFTKYFRGLVTYGESSRIQSKPLNDHLVITTLKIISRRKKIGSTKPIQLHTGLGDSDINLLHSNPAYLQPLIEKYPDVDFVLLHSSYPYTREAGYLATVFANAYLDIGEVFPMTSRDAQISIVRQSLELVPSSKILWSTDGHYHPETFWLANKQFRHALGSVFKEYVSKGDYTLAQAMEAAQEIMFYNSNLLYRLNQSPKTSITVHHKSTVAQHTSRSLDGSLASGIEETEEFLQRNPSVDFIWLQFVDYTNTVRVRMLPVQEFKKLIVRQRRVGITLGLLNLLQNDHPVPPEPLIAGQFYLRPDLSTLCRNVGTQSKSASVMTFWDNENGSELGGCPRSMLRRIVDECQKQHSLKLLSGFEIEVVFMKKATFEDGSVKHTPWLTNHSWSNITSETRSALPIIEEIVNTLAEIDIHVEQFHAESSPGQFEFILPPASPLPAVDTLIKARQTIVNIAEQHDLRATLHPRPFASAGGTAAHAHLSIDPTTRENSFLASILKRLPALLAFTLPQQASYARVTEGIWAGGVWVAWGDQNRETPLRRVSPGHWELKAMDGLANPYLAMAAVIATGYLGLKEEATLDIKGCNVDTSTLTPSQRDKLGIKTPMPRSLEESLSALEADGALRDILGRDFVKRYIGVRRGEDQMLKTMNEEDRREWLIARY